MKKEETFAKENLINKTKILLDNLRCILDELYEGLNSNSDEDQKSSVICAHAIFMCVKSFQSKIEEVKKIIYENH